MSMDLGYRSPTVMHVLRSRLTTFALASTFACGSSEAAVSDGGGSSEDGTSSESGTTTTAESSGGSSSIGDSASETGTVLACDPAPPCTVDPEGGPRRVELRIASVDDLVLAHVNGLQREVWALGTPEALDSGRVDITPWFVNGENTLTLSVANTGGPANFVIQVWIDDALVLDAECSDPGDDCELGLDAPLGYVYRRALAIESRAFACATQVCVDGIEPGAIYLDGVHTGLTTPDELLLPAGAYAIGIGSDNGDPSPDEAPSYTYEGRFRERRVEVVGDALGVVLDDGDRIAARPASFLIVPLREVLYANGDMGVLEDETPTRLAEIAAITGERWAEPFSYGLVRYDAITVHPMIEAITLEADADGFVNVDPVLEAGLVDAELMGAHDVIVWTYPMHLESGEPVASPPCCAWGGGNFVWMNDGWYRDSAVVPNAGFLHEWLHTVEDEATRRGFGGISGLHGAEDHGYVFGQNGEDDWLYFYRHFMRGHVVEDDTFVGIQPATWLSSLD